jgi:hypothetical protein
LIRRGIGVLRLISSSVDGLLLQRGPAPLIVRCFGATVFAGVGVQFLMDDPFAGRYNTCTGAPPHLTGSETV